MEGLRRAGASQAGGATAAEMGGAASITPPGSAIHCGIGLQRLGGGGVNTHNKNSSSGDGDCPIRILTAIAFGMDTKESSEILVCAQFQ